MLRKPICQLVPLLLLLGMSIACSNGNDSSSGGQATLQSLAISPDPGTTTIPVGAIQQFTAKGTFSDGSSRDMTMQATWASSDNSVISINSGGLAKALRTGSATISAASGTVTATASKATNVGPAAVVSIGVSPSPAMVAVGSTIQFHATATLTDGSTQDISTTANWASSNAAAATIAAAGLATGASAGSSTISATDASRGIKGSTVLTVANGNNNSKLNGSYTFRFQAPGSLAGTEPFVVGEFTADGAGNITNGILDLNPGGGGTFLSGVTFIGTYSIGSDNRGTITFTGTSSAYSFSGTIAVVSSGFAYVMETDTTGLAYGDIQLDAPGSFSNASVNGPYVFMMGTAGTGIVGQFTADGSGHISNGLVDANVGGVISNATLSGTYNITDAAHGRGTATITVNSTPPSVSNFQVYVGRGVPLMVNTDTNQPVRSIAVPQSGAPFGNGSLSGNYVLTGGSDLERFGGQFTANGAGSGNGLLDLFTVGGGTTFGVPFTVTYAVTDATHGRFTAVDTPQGGTSDNFVFYTVNANLAVMVDLNSANGAQGEFFSSSGGPYSITSLNGSYSFELQGCPLSGNNCTGEYTQTGVFTADGNGNITLSFDTNNFGAVSTQTLISGSYTVGDSGSDGGLITTSAGKIRFHFVDAADLLLEDGDAAPTRRVLGGTSKQN